MARDALLRALIVLFLGGPGLCLVLWPSSPATRSTAKTDDQPEPEAFAVNVAVLSDDDCFALLMDDLAAGTDRLQAVNEVARRGPRCISRLEQLLQHRTSSSRRYAAMALGLLESDAASTLPSLLRLSRIDDLSVQLPSIDALVRIAPRDPEVRATVLELLHSSSPTIQTAASDALLTIVRACPEHSPEFERILLECLDRRESPVQMMAVAGQAALSPPRIEHLSAALAHPEQGVRLRTMNVLGGLGRTAAPAYDNLLDATNVADENELAEARRTLAELAPVMHRELAMALASGKHALRPRAEAGLLLAEQAASDEDRALVAPALAAAVRELGHEPHWWARLVRTLSRRRAETTLVLKRLQADNQPHTRDVLNALQTLDPRLKGRLLHWANDMQDASPIVRARAAYSLGLDPIQASAFVNDLLACREDSDPEARRAVNWAISRIEMTTGPLPFRALRVVRQ